MNRAFITGCGGMLGEAVYPYFVQRYDKVLATDKAPSSAWCGKLDIRAAEEVRKIITEFKPELILHLAAETDLEFCEGSPEIAEATNVTGTRNVAELAEKIGATLVYISTAGVFDGEKEGFYTEEDEPNPIMVYGDTKFRGEKVVREVCTKHYVVRAGWMVGGGPAKDHKFVSKILDQILSGQKTLHVVTDRLGTPTYTYDFAMNLFQLLETKAYGTYHMVCEGAGSRHDVALELVRICKQHDVVVEPVTSEYFKDVYFAPRPVSEMMINANLEKLGINFMRPWRAALEEYVSTHYATQLQKLLSKEHASR